MIGTRVILLASLLAAAGGLELPADRRAESSTLSAGASSNLLPNGSFEEGVFAPTAAPSGWGKAGNLLDGALAWDAAVAHEGSLSVRIVAPTANDLVWFRSVTLEPDRNYLLSGWIKTENVVQAEG